MTTIEIENTQLFCNKTAKYYFSKIINTNDIHVKKESIVLCEDGFFLEPIGKNGNAGVIF